MRRRNPIATWKRGLALALAGALLGACGVSDAQADYADRLVQQGSYSREEADCFARGVDGGVGIDKLQQPGRLSADELERVATISRECTSARVAALDGAAARRDSAAGSGAGPDGASEDGAAPSQPVDPVEATVLRSTAIQELVTLGGYTKAVAECVVDALTVALGPEALRPQRADDDEVISARAQILQQCRNRK